MSAARPRLSPRTEDEKLQATAAYRRDHPLYARLLLRILARIHGLGGDPVESVARALPMVALRLQPPGGER
jgi:hypothetical protein